MNFIVAADTDIGIVKETNQDSYCCKILNSPIGKMAFSVLCDGMGGLKKGEIASASVVNAFKKWALQRLPLLCQNDIDDKNIADEWVELIKSLNEKLKIYGNECGIRLGTTVTAILLTEKNYYIVNVGDTRAYKIADKLEVLTKDHTVVAREIALGNLSEEQAKVDSRRSVLLQCVGASDEVYPDLFYGEIQRDAIYMLCTDGFRHEISPKEIYDYLNPTVMIEDKAMKNNIRSLIEINKERKERDNITAVAIRTF